MRVGEWTVIIVVMVLFLELMGIPTGLSVLTKFGINVTGGTASGGDLEGAYFWAQMLAILTVVGLGSAVLIGIFTKTYDTSIVVAPLLVSVVAMLGSTFFSIMSIPEIREVVWMQNIMIIIFAAMGISFIWSAVNYFRGLA